ncbi:hypothetical protein D3C87_1707980 [compost metagenome]
MHPNTIDACPAVFHRVSGMVQYIDHVASLCFGVTLELVTERPLPRAIALFRNSLTQRWYVAIGVGVGGSHGLNLELCQQVGERFDVQRKLSSRGSSLLGNRRVLLSFVINGRNRLIDAVKG